MPKLLPDSYRENPVKALWESFNSLDPFYKLFVVVAGLIIGVTPYIVNNYQTISGHAAIDCSLTLQSKIDAAASGSTLDLTGCTYTGTAIISKSLTLVGVTLMVPAGSTGLSVTASNVTLDGIHVLGPNAPSAYNTNEIGISVSGTSTVPVQALDVHNSEIGNLAGSCLLLHFVSGTYIQGDNVHDCGYTGVMLLSGSGGTINNNTISRVGYNVANLPGPNNAYGIALTEYSGEPPTNGTMVSGNTVTDVPTWHALDTHGGQNLTFSGNTVLRSSRGLFITDAYSDRATNILVTGNLFGNPSPVTFNLVAVTTYNTVSTNIINNNWSSGWNGNYFEDYENLSTGLIMSNNNIGESLPSPTSSPTPTPAPSSGTPTPVPTNISSPTPTPTPVPPTPLPTRTPTPTPTPKPLPTSTPSPLPTATLTPIPPTPIPTSSVLDQGDGLLGMYYANRNLSGLPLYRIDQDINFNWGWQGSPMAGIAGTNFSSRWSGFVAPLHSETYTFFATSDDGVRVWVNGVLIINGWYNHSSKTFTGNIFLYANQKYSLKVEYYQHQGYDLVNLKWSSPSTTKGVIPQSQLYTYN